MGLDLPPRGFQSCRVCFSEQLKMLTVREMQIGLADAFEYGACELCGAVTRLSQVENISKYYPEGYYSFADSTSAARGIKKWLRDCRNRTSLTGSSHPVGRLLASTDAVGTPIPQLDAATRNLKIQF